VCGVFVRVSRGPAIVSGLSVAASLGHRGPDSHGYERIEVSGWLHEFGHTRLAIRDLSEAGHQPMWSADGRWLISYNGELYNNDALRARLERSLRGHSDTETLVECLAAFGFERTLPLLNGMFAFVALDASTGTVHAVRDPSGIKPLYWSASARGIAFGSEIRALRDHGEARGGVDRAALSAYLTLRYVPSGATLIDGVRRLAAGEALTWRDGSLRSFRYEYVADDDTNSPAPRTLDEAVEQFGRQLERAVSRQLVSDVPVGVLLSGGLDSAVLAAIVRSSGVSAPCFTVGFSDDPGGASEIEEAAHTASVLGLPHYPLSLSSKDLAEVALRASDHIEEPLGTTSVLAMWHLCELARRNVTVALAGQGADEPLGGYRRHRVEAVRAALPTPVRLAFDAIGPAAGALAGSPRLASLMRVLGSSDPIHAYVAARVVFTDAEQREFGVEPGFEACVQHFRALREALGPASSEPAGALELDRRSQLPDDLLLYGDKVSMAHSLEVRVPFLDTDLVSWVERLPDRFRATGRRSKIVLREYARRALPDEIVDRPKKGFEIPNLLAGGAFLDAAHELVRDACAPGRLGIRADVALRYLDAAKRGGEHYTRAWVIYALAAWYHTSFGTNR
jgi:asparagine synthase (glutamine-hydrolysing)